MPNIPIKFNKLAISKNSNSIILNIYYNLPYVNYITAANIDYNGVNYYLPYYSELDNLNLLLILNFLISYYIPNTRIDCSHTDFYLCSYYIQLYNKNNILVYTYDDIVYLSHLTPQMIIKIPNNLDKELYIAITNFEKKFGWNSVPIYLDISGFTGNYLNLNGTYIYELGMGYNKNSNVESVMFYDSNNNFKIYFYNLYIANRIEDLGFYNVFDAFEYFELNNIYENCFLTTTELLMYSDDVDITGYYNFNIFDDVQTIYVLHTTFKDLKQQLLQQYAALLELSKKSYYL